jgi:hypothetical protein
MIKVIDMIKLIIDDDDFTKKYYMRFGKMLNNYQINKNEDCDIVQIGGLNSKYLKPP